MHLCSGERLQRTVGGRADRQMLSGRRGSKAHLLQAPQPPSHKCRNQASLEEQGPPWALKPHIGRTIVRLESPNQDSVSEPRV